MAYPRVSINVKLFFDLDEKNCGTEMGSKTVGDSALKLLRTYPRVSLGNIKNLPGSLHKKKRMRRNKKHGGRSGRGKGGQGATMTLPRIGFEGGNTPFYLKMPMEPYYAKHHLRRQYPPLSLLQLQRMIDLGRLNPEEPIDLNSICNTKLYQLNPWHSQYGINLIDEGADIFATPINIEVQWTCEASIAAVERVGGVITTRYYDMVSVQALYDPVKFFKLGMPIPRCALPPSDAIEYYTDPKFRGYLADPEKVAEERYKLAQKYGYELPDLTKSPNYEMLKKRKDPRQIFYGLNPGWVVCMRDKVVIKPKDQEYVDYYNS